MIKLKIYFETFGCTSNQADTAIMAGLLSDCCEEVDSIDACDVAVINSCGVVGRTERKVVRKVSECKAAGKKVVLTGCLPKINPGAFNGCTPNVILSPDSVHLIKEAADAAFHGSHFKPIPMRIDKTSIQRPKKQLIAPVPIAEGCIGSCSYCGTRFARGRLKSFEPESIIKSVSEAVSAGAREIQLTAQDTGIYGLNTELRLPELMEKVCTIEGKFMVRVGMMNPAHIRGILPELIDAFNAEKVYKFLHLPVQSGDDEILGQMRRGYSVRKFVEIVNEFRKRIPNLTLSTDVIVGYPTEDEQSFLKTFELIQKIRPDILNITRFSSRPNTLAASLKDLPDRMKKERSRRISSLAKTVSLEINKSFLGSAQNVLITEYGKKNTMLGRTNSYKQVVLKEGVLGETKKVRITGAREHYLLSE